MENEEALHYLSGCQVKHLPWKRAFDVTFSIAVLTFGFPIFFILGLIVKLTSKGPIFYSHLRLGRGGRPFQCYKFRSMHQDADAILNDLLTNDPSLRAEWENTHKLKNDPRITRIGKFLRKTSLDELPQFWNVIKGDLSIVGPRPVVAKEIIKHMRHRSKKILSLRPGITGLWQVSGRSDTEYSERIALDEKYVENPSLALDIALIAKTIPLIVLSRGAY